MFKITKDPSGHTYRELIELAFDRCDEFHFVLRKNMGEFNKVLEAILNEIGEIIPQRSYVEKAVCSLISHITKFLRE